MLERSVIRFLYGRPLETLLATWGVSLILQQAVRSIFGAPNKAVANPGWMTGGFDLIGGFTVTWNRLYIIVFCFVVLGALALILNRTSFGLHMRAVTQNRAMAAAMGIRTARVDALTFGLGSGIAGMAGVALSQIGNVSPNLGTIYIVDSFLVVVFGGVGNLMGTLVGALSLGIVNKFLEPVAGAILGKIVVLVAIILFIQRRPRGLFALKGRTAEAEALSRADVSRRGRDRSAWGPRLLGRPLSRAGVVLVAGRAGAQLWARRRILPIAAARLPRAAARQISVLRAPGAEPRSDLGLCRHLEPRPRRLLRARRLLHGHVPDAPDRHARRLRQPGAARFHGVPELARNCRGSGGASTISPVPRRWWCWCPGLLALVFGWLAFRSRVTGVYLSIITQAMTYALMLAFFRNDMGFGGNNGLTDFKDMLGLDLHQPATRLGLYRRLGGRRSASAYLVCRFITTSKLGRVLLALRDAESRVRFLGYSVTNAKLFVFTVSAVLAGIAGALYVPQVGIINPSEFSPGNSIEIAIWVSVGGRGTLVGADRSARSWSIWPRPG